MKILICSDGSPQAETAIRLVTSFGNPDATVLGIIENPSDENPLLDALKRGVQILRDRQINVELTIKSGQPIEEISKRTTEANYDLVVIGATRKGDSGPLSMSAKAYELIKLVRPPVLVVIGDRTELKKILICSGGKNYINNAVTLVGRLAAGTQARVTLLHVMAEAPALYADLIERQEDVSRLLESSSALGCNLRAEKGELEALRISTEVRLRHGLVVHEVFQEIEEGAYDLVVTGSSHATGALQTYIMGDVTSEIVNRVDCPVLVARGQNEQPLTLRRIFSRMVRPFRPQAKSEAT